MRGLVFLLSFLYILTWCTYAYTSSQFLAAKNLGEQGIIVAQKSLNDYRLDETMTRKEFMKVLAMRIWDNIENECDYEFWDVRNDWGCKYIEWAMRKAFINQDRYFRPNKPISKAESMKLILKARDISRIQKTSDWRVDDMKTAFHAWIIELEYSDYTNPAMRWWIFEALATQEEVFTKKAIEKRDAQRYKIWTYIFRKDLHLHIN